jgi:hypothetical protein
MKAEPQAMVIDVLPARTESRSDNLREIYIDLRITHGAAPKAAADSNVPPWVA